MALPLHAANIPWTNALGGNFTTVANWNSGAGPVPGSGDVAQFNIANTYTVTFNTNPINSALSVGGSTVSFRPDTVASRTYSVGSASVTTGSLTLAAPSSGTNTLQLEISGGLSVNAGRTLTVNAGNDISSTNFNLATNTSGTATALFDGTGSSLTVVGDTTLGLSGGVANLTLQNNATASFANMFIANSGSSGTGANVLVQSGADITALGTLNLGTGSATGQVSNFTVTGTSSSVTQTGAASLFIGSTALSSATLTLGTGGIFTTGTGTTNIAPTGLLQLNGGTFDANGNISVNGGTFTQSSGSFSWEASRTLTISAGGTVNLANFSTPASTFINVTGSGSELNLNGSIGVISSSQLTITSGASLTSSAFVDTGTSGNGTTIVDGTGSSITSNAASPSFIGTDGTGTLTIRNNATGSFGGLRLGNVPDSVGILNLESGATLSLGSLQVGNAAVSGAQATVNITGATLNTTASANISIGLSVNGDALDSININTGGFITMGSGTTTINTSGRLNLVSGSFTTSGFISLDGIINASSGATFIQSPSSTIALNPGSAINITNSNVTLGSLLAAGGIINFNSGLLSLRGNITLGNSGPLGDNLNLGPNQALILTGNTIINPQRQLTLSGGSLTTANILNSGTFTFNSGSLTLTNPAGITIGSGGPLGSVLSVTSGRNYTITGPTTISSTGILLIADGSFNPSGGLSNFGEIKLAGLAPVLSGAAILNSKLIRGDGRIDNTISNLSTGEIRAEAGKTLLFTGSFNANQGRINLQGGTIQISGDIINAATGKITGTGFFYADLGLNNMGEIQLSAGFSSIYGTVTNGNKITVSGGGTATFYDTLVMSPGSTFQTSTNSTSVFFGPVIGTGTFTGPGVKNFESGGGGSGSVLASLSTVTGTTRVGPDASVEVGFFNEASVIVEGSLLLTPGQIASRTSSLTLTPTALFNTSDNDLIIDYTGTSPLSDLLAAQITGQLTSNALLAGNSTLLVLFEAADIGLTEFAGISVDESTVIGKYTYTGDANLDGQVDAFDYSKVDDNFGTPGSFITGDLNQDGFIDAFDYAAIDDTFGAGIGNPLRPSASTEVFIPEPSSMGLLVLASGLLARRRV